MNFASFVIVAIANGGDALKVKIEKGRYFLANHGRYTDVTEGFFHYSRIHATTAMITMFVAVISVFLFARSRSSR